ncbi:intersectin [Acrasis kona]|uniref:Intersectin n=1 Tax=Acrasis kona TaxID=1008807 RepID=A0AAW2ZQE3_9EUKA
MLKSSAQEKALLLDATTNRRNSIGSSLATETPTTDNLLTDDYTTSVSTPKTWVHHKRQPSKDPASMVPIAQCVIIHEFHSEGQDEINLVPGDVALIFDNTDPEWWMGCTRREKRMGYIPSSFCFSIQDTRNVQNVTALYDLRVNDPNVELEFNKNDVLNITEKRADGWWFGTNVRTKKSGLIPSNYTNACRLFEGT